MDRSEARPVALVAGGGTGVGAAVARAFAARGWAVAILFRSSAAGAEATVAACAAAGGGAVAVRGDVAADADCRAAVDATLARWGRLDAVVNSAAVTQFTSLADLDAQNAADFLRVYEVNVVGAFQLARAARPALAAARGALVHISSVAGARGSGSSLAYVASKGALNSLTLALARLFAPDIRVNAVAPGFISSDWFTGALGTEAVDTMRRGFAEASPLGDVCTPDDVAALAVHLAADARMMTGQVVTLDGGYSLGHVAAASRR